MDTIDPLPRAHGNVDKKAATSSARRRPLAWRPRAGLGRSPQSRIVRRHTSECCRLRRGAAGIGLRGRSAANTFGHRKHLCTRCNTSTANRRITVHNPRESNLRPAHPTSSRHLQHTGRHIRAVYKRCPPCRMGRIGLAIQGDPRVRQPANQFQSYGFKVLGLLGLQQTDLGRNCRL